MVNDEIKVKMPIVDKFFVLLMGVFCIFTIVCGMGGCGIEEDKQRQLLVDTIGIMHERLVAVEQKLKIKIPADKVILFKKN